MIAPELGQSVLYIAFKGSLPMKYTRGSVRLMHQALIGQDPPSFTRGPINRMVTFGGPPIDPLKLTLSITVSNSHSGKRSAARVLTIFSFHFLPNIVFSY